MTTSYDPTTPSLRPTAPIRRIGIAVALLALFVTVMATWLQSAPAVAKPAPKAPPTAAKAEATEAAAEEEPKAPKTKKAAKAAKGKREISGKLNLNNATVEQFTLLPGVGPSKAERVIAYRKKNGDFKRVADLRKVKGFGYKTLKKLEPYLDIKGTTTLAAK